MKTFLQKSWTDIQELSSGLDMLDLFKAFLLAALAFLLIVICMTLSRRIRHSFTRGQMRVHQLTLQNMGNAAGYYKIRVKEGLERMHFDFFVGENTLPVSVQYKETVSAQAKAPTQMSKLRVNEVSNLTVVPDKQKQEPVAVSGMVMAADKRKKQIKNSGKKLVAGASFLDIVGRFIPGSLGRQIRSNAQSIRDAQLKVSRIERTPQNLQNQLHALENSSQQIGIKKPEQPAYLKDVIAAKSGMPAVNQNQSFVPQAIEDTQKIESPGNQPVQRTAGAPFVRSPHLRPTESVVIDVKIGLLKPSHEKSMQSYQLEVQFVPLERLAIPSKKHVLPGIAAFDSQFGIKRVMPVLLTAVIVCLSAALLTWTGSVLF